MVRKRILFLEATRSGIVGGSLVCLLDLVRSLDPKKFEPIVALRTEFPIRQQIEKVCKVIIVQGKEYVQSDRRHLAPEKPGPLKTLSWLLSDVVFGALALYRVLLREKIDLLHLNNHIGFDLDGTLAAKLYGIPCVVHERGFLKVDRAASFLSKYVDALVCISESVKSFYETEKVFPKKILRIYDGLDASQAIPTCRPEVVRQILGIETNAKVLGIVGTIQPWKGQREVISALAHIKKKYPNIQCLIVGPVFDFDYAKKIQALSQELNLDNNVQYLGFRDDVLNLMNAMDIVIHASTSPEPLGRVLMEAMALEKPVIATRAGGAMEIIEEGITGFLVTPGNAKSMSVAMRSVLDDRVLAEKMGKAGRLRVERLFPLKKNAEQLESLYEDILSRV